MAYLNIIFGAAQPCKPSNNDTVYKDIGSLFGTDSNDSVIYLYLFAIDKRSSILLRKLLNET